MEKLMKTLSLKLEDRLYEETENMASAMNMERNKYIKSAVHLYNLYNKRKNLKTQLHAESKKTQLNSLQVLLDFETIVDNTSAF